MLKKKTFNQHTFSSTNKINQNPVNIREKLTRLHDAIDEIKTNIAHEDNHLENLEKINNKNFNILNTQIKALRKAFNTLADVVMEEIDSLKTELFDEIENSHKFVSEKVDSFQDHIFRIEREKENELTGAGQRERVLREEVHEISRKTIEISDFVGEVAESIKSDNQKVIEKLKNLIFNNTSQIELVVTDNKKLHSLITELKSQLSSQQKIFIDLEEQNKSIVKDSAQKSQDLKSQINNIKDNLKQDTQNILKSQTELTKLVEQQTIKMNEKLEKYFTQTKENLEEYDNILNGIQMEFQENLQDLAKITKESSNQIIADFEKALNSCSNDTKLIFKKVSSLENIFSCHREELSSLILEQEGLFSKKNDQINRAIFEICRNLNISNPLLLY